MTHNRQPLRRLARRTGWAFPILGLLTAMSMTTGGRAKPVAADDLTELLGALIENAALHAWHRVRVAGGMANATADGG